MEGNKVSAEPSDDPELRAVVVKYIEATKAWPPGDYSIQRSRAEGETIVFEVIHKDDLERRSPGGGKSIEVYVDTRTLQVSKELGFQ